MPAKILDISNHFWSRVDRKENPYACWEWKGPINTYRMGYGIVSIHRKTKRAHRVAFELAYGNIPDGKLVLHKCDNPRCCNPAHLFLGSHKDNSRDMVSKGRMSIACWKSPNRKSPPVLKGEKNPMAKLNWIAVRKMRNKHTDEGTSVADLAREFGISWTLAKMVIANQIWNPECDS